MRNPLKKRIEALKTDVSVTPRPSVTLDSLKQAVTDRNVAPLSSELARSAVSIETTSQLDEHTILKISANISQEDPQLNVSFTKKF